MTTKSEKRVQKHLLEAKNDEKRPFLRLFFTFCVVIKILYETVHKNFLGQMSS